MKKEFSPEKLHGFYRIRPISRLLGEYGEIEKQEIFMAPMHSLNDPLEEYRNIIWNGEKADWKRLLNHYDSIFCVANIINLSQSNIDIESIVSNEMFRERYAKDFLEDAVKDGLTIRLIQPMLADGENYYDAFAELLSRSKLTITSEKLISILIQLSEFISRKFISFFNSMANINHDTAHEAKKFALDFRTEEKSLHLKLLAHIESYLNQDKHTASISSATQFRRTRNFLNEENPLNIIPFKYVERLDKLTYPETLVSCFMGSKGIQNPISWSHYGQGHTGAALIFDFKTLNASVNELNRLGKLTKWNMVSYQETIPTLDAFKLLKNSNSQTITSYWGSDNSAPTQELLISNENVKTPHWSYEDESRLLYYPDSFDFRDANGFALKFSIESLVGVIFGMKTKQSDINEVIRLVQKKSKPNHTVDFFISYFCPDAGAMRAHILT